MRLPWLFWLIMQMLGKYLKLGHNRSFPHSLLFIIHRHRHTWRYTASDTEGVITETDFSVANASTPQGVDINARKQSHFDFQFFEISVVSWCSLSYLSVHARKGTTRRYCFVVFTESLSHLSVHARKPITRHYCFVVLTESLRCARTEAYNTALLFRGAHWVTESLRRARTEAYNTALLFRGAHWVTEMCTHGSL
jgi:hypothetical protein